MKTITRNSLLYKTGVEYGDYTINHVLGCSHGCKFPCYAYQMAKRYGNVKNYQQWINPKIVSNSLEILDREIPKLKKKIKTVQLSFTTDPFMVKQKEIERLTISIIRRLNKDNIKTMILTKGIIPKSALKTKKYNAFGITLVSLDENFRKKFEPFTSTYKNRVKSLKIMHKAGFKTWVSIEPYPTPNIIDQNLHKILKTVSFVDYIVFGRWHYNKKVSEYRNYKRFYNKCAEEVSNFCKFNKIKCHIKKGTRTN